MSQTPGRERGPDLLGIDYGTESCRVGVFDTGGRPLAMNQVDARYRTQRTETG